MAEDERRRDWTRKVGAAMNRARSELDRGAYADARIAVDEALALDPNNSGALTLRQRIEAAVAAEQERARQEQAARERERDERLAAAEAALSSDNLTGARTALERAVALGAGEAAAHLRGRIDERARARRRAATAVAEAGERFARGELDAALKLADEALTIEPAHVEGVPLKARIVRAIEEKRARDEWIRVTVEGARVALQKGEHDAALERLHHVREAEPAWPGLRALIDEATALRNAELERRRHEEQVRRAVAEVETLVGRQELDRARTALDEVRRLERDTQRVRELAAKVEAAIEAKRAEEARRRAEEERRRHEEQVRRAVAEVESLITRVDFDRARAKLEDARRLEPDTPRMRDLAVKLDAAIEAKRADDARRRAEEERRRAEEERRRAEEERRRAEEERRLRLEQIARGRAAFEAGQIDEAMTLLEAVAAASKEEPGFTELLQQVRGAHERLEAERRAVRERARRIAAALDRARKHLGSGEFDAADKSASEALAIDAAHADALATKTQIAAALTERVDSLIRSAEAEVTRGRHAKAVETLERAGIRHARLDAELERVRAALAAQLLEQRVDEAIKNAHGSRFRKRSPKETLAQLEQAGLSHPRLDQEIQAARRAVAHAATAATPVEPRSKRLVLAGVGVFVLVVAIVAIRQFWPSTGDTRGPEPPVTTATPGNQPPASSTPSTTATGTPAATPPVTTASPGTSAPPSASPPPTPSRAELATTAATGIDTLLAQGDHERALSAAASAATTFGDEPAVKNALGRLVSRAREDASQARGRVPRDAEASRVTLANTTFDSADRARRAGRAVDAARSFWRAESMFTTAASTRVASSSPGPSVPPAETPQAPPPRVETRENQPAAPRQMPSQSVPVPQPVTPANPQQATSEPARSTQPPPFDAAAVQRTLDAWAAAYASRNVANVTAVYPSLERREQLAQTFENSTSYDIDLSNCRITPGSATEAQAACSAQRHIRFRGGRVLNPPRESLRFTLERRGASWVITQLSQ